MASVVPLLVSLPYVLAARCGVDSCTDAVLETLAREVTANYKGFSSCESRMNWVKSNTGRTEVEACEKSFRKSVAPATRSSTETS